MKSVKKIFIPLTICITLLLLATATKDVLATDTLSPWSSSQSLPYPIANQAAFINNNTLNIIAGSTLFPTPNISYSTIDNNGGLSPWSQSTNFPSAIYWHSLAKKDNFIYVIGGTTYPPANSVNSVYLGTISNDTTIDWKQTKPLPEPNSMGNSITINNKIYSMGGFNMVNGNYSSFSNKVFMSNIFPDGNIEEWLQTSQMPKNIFGFGIINTNNKIITLGGRDESNTSISSIYEANIQTDGSIDTWTEIGNLPQPLSNAGVIIANKTIYVIGGANISHSGQVTWLNTVYFASIDENGSIGNWNISQYHLPKTICCGSIAASNTHLYLIGGYDGTSGSYTNDVYSTTVQSSLPQFPVLNVPDIKQYSSPWNSQIYDHANLWSITPTIERWGCALTSATMILRYYNFSTNPESLNNWLKNQQDGYIRNGLLNWLAISRYSKINSGGTRPSLEFLRLTNSKNNLINELNNDKPAILEEPGHYVVAKSQTIDGFGINDPGFSNKINLNSYGNTFNSIESYTPSQTDLSYIMIIIDKNMDIKIYDTTNNEITNSTFTQNSLNDDIDTNIINNSPVKIVLFPKPINGNYLVKVSGDGTYQLDSYLYDSQGNVTVQKTDGFVDGTNNDSFQIKFGGGNNIIQQITIDSIIDDWKSLYPKTNPISVLLLNIKRLTSHGNNKTAKIILRVVFLFIQNQTIKKIDTKIAKILLTEISTLISTL